MAFYLFSYTPSPVSNGVYSKREEFAHKGSKFFSFRVDPLEQVLIFLLNHILWVLIRNSSPRDF